MITTPQSRHTPCQFPLHRGAFKYASYDRNPAQLFDRSGITHSKNTIHLDGVFVMLALPIFPGRLQPSIVGRSELNFRVRDGNGWTLALISTNLSAQQCSVMPTHVQLLAP